MENSHEFRRFRFMMIILFLYSLISFGILQLGFVYLKDFLILIAMMKVASGMALVISIFSLLSIIAINFSIRVAKMELEKEKGNVKKIV
ncbi:hypothetical protein P4310_24750 [Bacillus thuringiensis]|uniref:hypothetical protein n=1 Tax=Bacillus thuringiensis TaxID=1428 RepID=UPI000A3A7991|nr:hypothetical protein [Bacillus thuringiensis]MED3068671.1 hypothetical protein [Bacillus thuringiensis]OUB30465.1 hypothetical protein BK737_17455 [Bacillus thuringiensis serovar palmanyolensis]